MIIFYHEFTAAARYLDDGKEHELLLDMIDLQILDHSLVDLRFVIRKKTVWVGDQKADRHVIDIVYNQEEQRAYFQSQ